MDDYWTAAFPGGVPFRQPTPGDVDDWTPAVVYGPHPSHVDVSNTDEDGEAPVTGPPCNEAIDPQPVPPPDGGPFAAALSIADAHSDGKETDTSPPQADPRSGNPSGIKTTDIHCPPPALVLTRRDIEIFGFLARHRMATYDQLALAFNTTTNALRQRLPRLHVAGYLAKESPGAPAFAVWMVTKAGMKRAGLDLPVPSFTTVYEHTLGLTDLAIMYARLGVRVLTEAEIKAGERKGAPNPPGLPRFVSPQVEGSRHRPDLVLYYPTSRPDRFRCVAVELELTRKGPKRLRPLLRAYHGAAGIHEVRYYTPDRDIAEGVANAAKAVGAARMVAIKKFLPPCDRAQASGR